MKVKLYAIPFAYHTCIIILYIITEPINSLSLCRSRRIRRQHKMVQIPTAAKVVPMRQPVVQLEQEEHLQQLVVVAVAREIVITVSLRWVTSQSRRCQDQLRLVTWSSMRRRTRRRAAVWCNNRKQEASETRTTTTTRGGTAAAGAERLELSMWAQAA